MYSQKGKCFPTVLFGLVLPLIKSIIKALSLLLIFTSVIQTKHQDHHFLHDEGRFCEIFAEQQEEVSNEKLRCSIPPSVLNNEEKVPVPGSWLVAISVSLGCFTQQLHTISKISVITCSTNPLIFPELWTMMRKNCRDCFKK